jgi:hypothetical protein
MRLLVGWAVSAAMMLAATAATAQQANVQGAPPYQAGVAPVSDIGGPYAAMPPGPLDQPAAPSLLPPQEVYTVLRDYGYAPLGAPRQRGNVYSIAVVDRNGEEGRLVIDARNGRIVRFVPSYALSCGSSSLFPPDARRVPRPPAAVPHVASRSVPLPKATPPRAVADPKPPAPVAAAPAPVAPQQSAAAAPAPAAASVAPPAAEAKPPVQIQPTQEMPKAQGLD